MHSPTTKKWSVLAGLGVLLVAGGAQAATDPTTCANDIDCVATPQCGGEVCPYTGAHPFTCQPAGTGPAGMDGWCTVDTDCKCHSLGATCANSFCTFTKPPSGSGGSSGGAGTAGSAGETGSAGKSGAGTAGSTGETGSAGKSGTGGSPGNAGASGSNATTSNSGCAVGGKGRGSDLLELAGLCLGVRFTRRRRRRWRA
jgi:hypothetical protein